MKLLGLASFASLATAHIGHDHKDDPQKPFVGWTKDDLDAKWGQDVCFDLAISLAAATDTLHTVGIFRHLDLRSPSTYSLSAASRGDI